MSRAMVMMIGARSRVPLASICRPFTPDERWGQRRAERAADIAPSRSALFARAADSNLNQHGASGRDHNQDRAQGAERLRGRCRHEE